jgi:hypothetical protein
MQEARVQISRDPVFTENYISLLSDLVFLCYIWNMFNVNLCCKNLRFSVIAVITMSCRSCLIFAFEINKWLIINIFIIIIVIIMIIIIFIIIIVIIMIINIFIIIWNLSVSVAQLNSRGLLWKIWRPSTKSFAWKLRPKNSNEMIEWL